jgi:hypothetical protein
MLAVPTIQIGPYRIQFFEADLVERAHVHIRRERLEAKYWLAPEIELFRNRGFEGYELTRIERLLDQNRDRLLKLWEEELRKKDAES